MSSKNYTLVPCCSPLAPAVKVCIGKTLASLAVLIAVAFALPCAAYADHPSVKGQGAESLSQEPLSSVFTTAPSSAATPIEPGDYLIVRADTNTMVFDAQNAGKANGTNVQLFNANNTKAQAWRITCDKRGYYTFTNMGSGLVLDVAWGAGVNGANVQLYAANGSLAQKWRVVKTFATNP